MTASQFLSQIQNFRQLFGGDDDPNHLIMYKYLSRNLRITSRSLSGCNLRIKSDFVGWYAFCSSLSTS